MNNVWWTAWLVFWLVFMAITGRPFLALYLTWWCYMGHRGMVRSIVLWGPIHGPWMAFAAWVSCLAGGVFVWFAMWAIKEHQRE